jgi:hypothetical protein
MIHVPKQGFKQGMRLIVSTFNRFPETGLARMWSTLRSRYILFCFLFCFVLLLLFFFFFFLFLCSFFGTGCFNVEDWFRVTPLVLCGLVRFDWKDQSV